MNGERVGELSRFAEPTLSIGTLVIALLQVVLTEAADLHDLVAVAARHEHLALLVEVVVETTLQVALPTEVTHIVNLTF